MNDVIHPGGTFDGEQSQNVDAQLMVNRAQLRTTLRNILGGYKRPVVAVTGPTQSGRSRSWHLINHVARAHNGAVQYIDLKIWVVEERTLDRLFDRLVADLALSGHVTHRRSVPRR